jgi:UDPglucose 6-dehydrogenase
MKIGIIGLGCIGSANTSGFEYLGHTVVGHDITHETTIDMVLSSEITFLCLPTPSKDDGDCDTSIVEGVIGDLNLLNYTGIIVIRSTVPPGFTSSMQEKFPHRTICFSPEFLRERNAEEDFIRNHKLLVVGTENIDAAKLIRDAHGTLPETFIQMTTEEAELLKYFNNSFAALRVTFANIFFELCSHYGADYTAVKNAYIKTGKAKDLYLNVDNDLRGFAGMCLPKDTKALATLISEKNMGFSLIEAILKDNEKFKKTIIGDMRL